MNIQNFQFEEIIKKGYSLDIVYILSLLRENVNISQMLKNSKKIEALYQTILRKELYNEETKCLTIEGEHLLNFIDIQEKQKFIKNVVEINTTNTFAEWWNCFPANNKFSHKGMSFEATRAFRVKKEDCKRLFVKIVNEKEYTAEQIINATKYDIMIKKDNSVKKRENQLTFLQNTYTYLYQKSFQGFVDLIYNDEKINSITVTGSIYI